ncbi:vomeronasal type-1 receptor 4-like [Lepus europaeus]|uniref:vomeronasal type-1 receptor 4-like n=1 Tax=Lepus europaeus TaxID=9983 RepID=UPI002B45A748|nr:vomeronasal type-1 receptor 4-like [Lepus europaeus]
MFSRDFIVGMVYLLQTAVGILGNFYLLYHYLFLYLTGYRVRSTGVILRHLTIANSLVILSKGVLQTMAAFGMSFSLSDVECKLVFYVHRVGRGVSISTTSLLSVFQVIIINPRNSRYAEFKAKALKYMDLSNILCWILHMMLNIMVLMKMTGQWSNKNITRRDYGFCYAEDHNNIIDYLLYTILLLFPDVFCLVLMLWASSSMIFILHRHRQQVQYIHRTSVSCKSAPEARATQNTLVLVSTFVSFYTLSSIFHGCFAFLNKPNFWLVNASTLIAACFPMVSPFILMIRDSSASRFSLAWIRNIKLPRLKRNT